jgi:hypothetical protein
MVARAGDALNTQDNVRRDDAEHNDLSHVHNLTRSRLGRLPMGHAQTQIALSTAGFSLASILDRQNLRLATAQAARPESRCASGGSQKTLTGPADPGMEYRVPAGA